MSETKIDGKTLNEWISIETTKRTVSFWGEDHEIEPVICSDIQGDGLQLVYVQSMDQRPNYWLLRIDSKINVEDDDFDVETLLEPLEEEFGREPENYCYDEKEFIKAKKDKNIRDMIVLVIMIRTKSMKKPLIFPAFGGTEDFMVRS